MDPTRGNDFKHLANTGVNTPGTTFPDSGPMKLDFPEADFRRALSSFNFGLPSSGSG